MKVSGKAGGVGSSRGVSGSPSPGAAKPAAPASAPAAQGDDLSVSGSAQFIAVAREQLAAVPDVRTEKVDAIKALMDTDSYHPDGEAVADGLIREHSKPRGE
jgi:negative regulator of flagellin synthesis FlgM